MFHFACNSENGPAVAIHHGALGAVILCECLTPQQASQEADRLNREARAIAEMAVKRYRPDCGWMHPRKSVRYFPDEDIHG